VDRAHPGMVLDEVQQDDRVEASGEAHRDALSLERPEKGLRASARRLP
jgi:hypothetical protein